MLESPETQPRTTFHLLQLLRLYEELRRETKVSGKDQAGLWSSARGCRGGGGDIVILPFPPNAGKKPSYQKPT